MLRLILIVVLAAALTSGIASAQAPVGPSVLRAEDLAADVAILEKTLAALHPGLLRYLSAQDLAARLLILKQAVAQQPSLAQAYVALSLFTASIRCGHTYPNFFNQSRSIQSSLFEATPRLPFYFAWLDGRMVVTQDFTQGNRLPRGTVIFSINGLDSPAILQSLMRVIRADGSNDAKRISQLEVNGDSLYEPFDVYFPLLVGLAAGPIKLQVKRPGERHAASVNVDSLTYAQRIAPILARETDRNGGSRPLFNWKNRSNGSAYLRMPTWALFNSHWDWRAWLDKRLDVLVDRHPSALIIDLRGNEGGMDIGDAILERLIDHDLALDQMIRLVRYRSAPTELLPYLDTWDPSFKDWGADATPLSQPWPTAPDAQYFRLAGEGEDPDARRTLHRSAKQFKGSVFVLVDASNSSATFQFAKVIQDQHLGLLVGQPTGGNQRGINGGAFFFLRLPRSGLEVDMPLIGTFPRSPAPDAGLEPDVRTVRSIRDITSAKDVELAFVDRLIAKQENIRPH